MIDWQHIDFPEPDQADKNGILCFGGDLTSDFLLSAYYQGIFPWFSEGDPVVWWCPDPRFVLYPDEFHLSGSMKTWLRNKGQEYRVSYDSSFKEVILNCSKIPRKDQAGTWITSEMLTAYMNLHDLGYAHSVEIWREEKLVGGLYGVSLGNAFFGESMFSLEPNTSKLASYHLSEFCKSNNFDFIDCQVYTSHLETLGARMIPRNDFLSQLQNSLNKNSLKGKWSYVP